MSYADMDHKKKSDDDAYLTIPAKRYYVIGDLVIPKWTGYIFLSGLLVQQILFGIIYGSDIIGNFYLAIGLWYLNKNIEYWFIFTPLYAITVGLTYLNIRKNRKEGDKPLKSVQPSQPLSQ